ncbi:hypothetical protein [Dinoroseobacter sp. S76]
MGQHGADRVSARAERVDIRDQFRAKLGQAFGAGGAAGPDYPRTP